MGSPAPAGRRPPDMSPSPPITSISLQKCWQTAALFQSVPGNYRYPRTNATICQLLVSVGDRRRSAAMRAPSAGGIRLSGLHNISNTQAIERGFQHEFGRSQPVERPGRVIRRRRPPGSAVLLSDLGRHLVPGLSGNFTLHRSVAMRHYGGDTISGGMRTNLPMCDFRRNSRCASTMFSSGKILAITGRI